MAKKLLNPIGAGGASPINYWEMRELARGRPTEFLARVQKGLEEGKFSLQSIRHIDRLYAALADVPVQIMMPDAVGNMRAITTSAFPVLVGNTIVFAVNAAYDSVPTIGDQLVTELDDDHAITVVAQINANNVNQDKVKEGDDFPEISASEEITQIGEWRNGRVLRISAETISRNQVSNIVDRVNALGRIASVAVEELTLKRVTDYSGSGATPAAPYVYKPDGTGAALYSTSANTPGKRAPSGTRINTNPLSDETHIATCRAILAMNRDDLGKPLPINVNECILLGPDALAEEIFKIKHSELIPSATGSFQVNPYGPKGIFGGYKPLTSNRLDQWSTTAWYFGMFNRQFRRKWALRMEMITLGESTQAYLNSRIAFQARLAWNCEVGATDYVWVIQNLTSTTPPS